MRAQADAPAAGPVLKPQPIVVDLSQESAASRAANRAAINAAINDATTLTSQDDADLEAVLAGSVTSSVERRGREAAREAALAHSCAVAKPAALAAILDLGAALAAGASVADQILGATAVAFRCAHESGQTGDALRFAQTLRSLGQLAAPKGIDEATWTLYPELDGAGNVTMAAVTIESSPPGAEVWINHQKRGTAPLTLHIRQGAHFVAVASALGVAAKTIDVAHWTHSENLTVKPAVGRWTNVASLIGELRGGKRPADGGAISELFSLTGAELAIVIIGGGTLEAWRRNRDGGARRVGQRRDAKQAVALLSSGRGGRTPDPAVPLLRETDDERKLREKAAGGAEKPAKWWVYAAVVGAAAIGAGIIVFGSPGDDRQRFEITLP